MHIAYHHPTKAYTAASPPPKITNAPTKPGKATLLTTTTPIQSAKIMQ